MARDPNTATVPTDLSTVTSYVPDRETDPVQVGMSPNSVDVIWEKVKRVYRSGYHPAIMVCIRRQGKVIIDRAIGHSHGNGPGDPRGARKVQATPETPVCLFSASKAVTAMLTHLLAERGEIDLDDPVAHYLPEFGCHGKDRITIAQMLCHRGGIPFVPPGTPPEIMFNWDATVEFLCHLKPHYKPGRRLSYHAITGGYILGEILHRVTGQDIREFFAENVQRPLGMPNFNYGADEETIPRVATNYVTGKPLVFPVSKIVTRALGAGMGEVTRVSNDPRFLRATIPAGNMIASADEINRFYQVLLNGGELDGVRIFSEETVARATANVANYELDHTLMFPMRYTLGMMKGNRPFGLFGPNSQDAYGHLGYMTILTWADPSRQISVTILNTGKAVFGGHVLPLVNLLTAINRECAPV